MSKITEYGYGDTQTWGGREPYPEEEKEETILYTGYCIQCGTHIKEYLFCSEKCEALPAEED